MSQKHFKDDPNIGRRFTIEGELWEVSDVWVDIGAEDDEPRTATLDQVFGEDFGLYMPVDQLASLTPE